MVTFYQDFEGLMALLSLALREKKVLREKMRQNAIRHFSLANVFLHRSQALWTCLSPRAKTLLQINYHDYCIIIHPNECLIT